MAIKIIDDQDVSVIILVELKDGGWTLTSIGLEERVPVPRAWMAQALRQLADAFEEQANEVGD